EIFDELVILLGDLSEESMRAKREDLSEDELTVFDMLVANKKISDKEKTKIKEAARELLERLKEKEFKVDHWTEKVQTTAAVRKIIEDYLFLNLPYPTYDEDVSYRAEMLFNDFKERFANYAA
ncbi:MAG: type I restriction enzyme endonuclease domain-containing protein, partial [Polaribacter sp.]